MFSVIFLTLSTVKLASAIKVEFKLSASTQCKNSVPNPAPFIDAVTLYHTDDNNIILSAARFPHCLLLSSTTA
ncbi:hypothetical protein GCK32_009532 [Trichostrongylus colubriformis]|uniref:Uncharacterized protein n=1 Tax=Trichostrongylus colubriformis TaxID=6319 RepID=A0AAN8FVF8_TRICO